MLKMVAGQTYLNLSKLSLTSEQGNPQISMIGAFSAILTNKWISLTVSGAETSTPLNGLNLSNMYALPAVAVNSLKAHPIFKETSKEEVDGKPVYNIELDANGLFLVAKDIVSNETVKAFLGQTSFTDAELQEWASTFVANAQFNGTMTINSKKDIVLTINTLNLNETGTEVLR